MAYSKELRESIVARMLPPKNESISRISKEEGLPEATLRKWRDAARVNGFAAPANDAPSDKWSTEDKFLIVLEAAGKSEIELAEYCRQKGLYIEQVQAWKDACMQANGGVAKESTRLNRELKEKEKEVKSLEKEIQRKDKALAETAALLVLRKKSQCDLGGPRGRLISTSDRKEVIKLIKEATAHGAILFKACSELGITERTYYRWCKLQKNTGSIEDLRPLANRPKPVNKLSPEEEQMILNIVKYPEYASLAPCEIVPTLADKGIYVASESTFYRVLRKHSMQHHRGRNAEAVHRPISTHYATAPNQVWMWDITYLNGAIKGKHYYLYLISDLFSRKIVGWEIWPEETAEHASELIRRAIIAERIAPPRVQPLVLHSDNGSPMKGATMLETLYRLGITPSNSRPRVSNDNPYAESLFKTLKYRCNYQPKGFATITEARLWCKQFENWYNNEHRHSGINYLTPNQRHCGQANAVFEARHAVYQEARAKRPERWTKGTRDWTLADTVWLNPEKENILVKNENSDEKAS